MNVSHYQNLYFKLKKNTTKLFERVVKCLECTGDTMPSRSEIILSNIIVSTPEKWDVISRKGTGDSDLVSQTKLIIIDEVHILASDRGPVLESLVARTYMQMEHQQSKIRLVALSATLPNFIDVANFLKIDLKKGLFFFDGRFRSTPLGNFEKYGFGFINLMASKVIARFLFHLNKF